MLKSTQFAKILKPLHIIHVINALKWLRRQKPEIKTKLVLVMSKPLSRIDGFLMLVSSLQVKSTNVHRIAEKTQLKSLIINTQ